MSGRFFRIVCAPSRPIDGGALYGMGVWAIVSVLHLCDGILGV